MPVTPMRPRGRPADESSGLEEELARRLGDAEVERGAVAVASAETRRPDDALARIA